MKKLNTDIFIERSKEIHENIYDYSLVLYLNNYTKIKIICKEHGVFEQFPKKHLIGRGCQKCGGTHKLTTNEFIRRAKEIHGNEYNYDESKYTSAKVKIKIKCRKHGIFEQEPYSHLIGTKCSLCYGSNSLNTDIFINKSKEIHGNT